MTRSLLQAPVATSPWRSFWMGGFEGADHVNGPGRALDMLQATGHLDRLDEDHAAAAALGLRTVRESVGWRLAEPAPGRHDFGRARRIARSARRHGVQVVWSFMHYGVPPDLSLFDDALIDRFARFAAALARELAPLSDTAPVYNLVNEIGFVSWAACEGGLIHTPHAPAGAPARSAASGYAVKRRLVRAVLAARQAVLAQDPRARFLHVEPLVHVVAPAGRADLAPLAREVCGYQWQAWDLIAGRSEPALGGTPDALDLIGVNHYHSGQWEVQTERRLPWHTNDPRRRPLACLLEDCWQRYGRPLIVAETSHFGVGRAAWLNDMAAEVWQARRRGIPVDGLCLYPLIDRPDWDDAAHWHHSGLWDLPHACAVSGAPAAAPAAAAPPAPAAADRFSRVLNPGYAAALRRWQAQLPESETTERTSMTTLIVFSHLRWGFVWQRPQHLLSRLARHYRVVFVEEPMRAEGPARLDFALHDAGIEVLTPRTPVEAGGFHDDQLPVLRPLLADYLNERGIVDYLVWFYTPMALPLISQMRPRAVVYDCMDELAAFKGAPRQLRQREQALLKTAGVMFTGGPALFEARRERHPNVHCLPSAVDAEHFSPARLDPHSPHAAEAQRLQSPIGTPRLGFFGVIDERLDVGLLTRLADARPDWHIAMVGPVVKIDPASLPRRPNLHWLGMQPYERLPYLMASWDVCLMPFALNEATRYISPTKTLEYMAAEKPVVSTAVQDVIALYGDLVRVAADADDFIAACAAALVETRSERARRVSDMLSRVSGVSWEHSAATVHALLQAELDKAPRAADGLHAPADRAASAVAPIEAPQLARAARPAAARAVRPVIVGAGPLAGGAAGVEVAKAS